MLGYFPLIDLEAGQCHLSGYDGVECVVNAILLKFVKVGNLLPFTDLVAAFAAATVV